MSVFSPRDVASDPNLRAPQTGGRRRGNDGAKSSCDLLLTLCTRSPVSDILGASSIGPGQLLAARDELVAMLGPEPADWRVRLADRGGTDGDLEQLLAICRSADSHAYQLLELLGANCASLRKQVIERLRQERGASLHQRTRGAVARPVAATMSRQRRGLSTPTNEDARPTRTPRTAEPSPQAPPSRSPRTRPAQARVTSPRRASTAPASVESASARAPAAQAAPAAPQPDPEVHRTPPALADRRIDPSSLPVLHGRERELEQLADALGRRGSRVPLMVGSPGGGRTLLAKHLAAVLDVPVFHLEATAYDDESTLAEDLEAIAGCDGIAIFDALDRVPSEAAPPFLGALSHAWTTARPRVLTIVSPEGHGRLGTWLPGAVQSADVVTVDPLSGPDMVAAVRDGATAVLRSHGVELAPDAKLGELTRWSERYLTGLAMPGRALDLLDLACARAVRHREARVRREVWLEIVSERSGLPPGRIESHGDQDILDLESRLRERVVGHEEAIASIASLIRRNRAGFGGHRPIATALLLGPSGVGKTELAKAVAESLFDRPDALVRLDMSEYSEAHAVARIVGAPPGYVGHEQGGALTDPLLKRPHCVVLLDEIEKAHRDVHQLLLAVFDDGRLTDGRGRTVDFRHAAILMTSNLGADRIRPGRSGPRMDESEVCDAARSAFPVELWNRIEAPLVMQPLGKPQMQKICQRLAATSSGRLEKERGIRFALTDGACDHLVALAGRDPSLGARPLRHLLVRDVESVLADAILRGQLRAGMAATVDVRRGQLVLR